MQFFSKSWMIGSVVVLALFLCGIFFFHQLSAVDAANTTPTVFEIKQGEGFRAIASNLYAAHLIRSTQAFDVLALIGGHALTLKPGLFKLSQSMDAEAVIHTISGGAAGEAMVTIPEGSNIYDIDGILSAALVIHPGDLINYKASNTLEGHLFPDTYQFYTNANVKDVVQELLDNFNNKAAPLLATDLKNQQKDLIIASILEKEVPDQQDQELVAGIILKRLTEGIPLDIDATVCYAKFQEEATSSPRCGSLSALDLKISSPYNTYLYKGLPPGPIGNPGISAITAALHPESSPYLYYVSDPKTGKTIFAKSLGEQNQNIAKYLHSN